MYYNDAYITTPNGSNVAVWEAVNEITQENAQSIDNEKSHFVETGAVLLENATGRYNCHSYAWYSQDTATNNYWMSDPSTYWEDGSYIEVTQVQPGDIVCYRGMATILWHSGIVYSVQGTQTVTWDIDPLIEETEEQRAAMMAVLQNIVVKSKWGEAGLYQHRGDNCREAYPQWLHDLVFYRYNHTHNAEWSAMDIRNHAGLCICGAFVEEAHVWRYLPKNVSSHTKVCTECGYSTTEAHVYIKYGEGYRCKKCLYSSLMIPVPNPTNLAPALKLQLTAAIESGQTEILLDTGNGAAIFYSNGQCYILLDENMSLTQTEKVLDMIYVEPIYRNEFETDDGNGENEKE